jgi:hypothetical protein
MGIKIEKKDRIRILPKIPPSVVYIDDKIVGFLRDDDGFVVFNMNNEDICAAKTTEMIKPSMKKAIYDEYKLTEPKLEVEGMSVRR